jgi:hypothetical protein
MGAGADPTVLPGSAGDAPRDAHAAPFRRRHGALARQQRRTADVELDRAIGARLDADHRGSVVGAHPRRVALPARRGGARREQQGEPPRKGRPSRRPCRPVRTVADCRQVRARRRNHGRSVPAAELADKALRAIVPADRLRLVRVQIAWADALPARLLRVASPVAIDDHTLVVHVADNQWLHELQYLRSDLLDRIREAIPDGGVTQLRMRVGEVAPIEKPEPPPPVQQRPVLSLQPATDTLEAIASIPDDGLRDVIATARQALTRLGRAD